jgi:hypothetical protein
VQCRSERRDELGRSRIAVARLLRERGEEDVVEAAWQVRPRGGQRRDLPVDVRGGFRGDRVAGEGTGAGEQLPGDDGERVTVARGRRALAAGLLRREVRRGTEHGARPGQRVQSGGVRDPEVGHVQVPGLVEQQIGRLDVAVHHALRVRVVERGRCLLEPFEGLPHGHAALAHTILERAAGEMLHHEVRRPAVLADVEDRDDVRAAGEPRGGERLAREPLADGRVAGVGLRERLDRDVSSEQLVGRAVDLAHPAATDQPRLEVAIRQQIRPHRHAAQGCRPQAPENAGGRRSLRIP